MKTVNGIQSDGIETDRIQSDGSSDGANGAHRAQCNSSGIPSLEAGKEAILIMKNKILFNKNASLLCSLLLFCSDRLTEWQPVAGLLQTCAIAQYANMTNTH